MSREFEVIEKYWWQLFSDGFISASELKVVQLMMKESNSSSGNWCLLSSCEMAKVLDVSARQIRYCLKTLTEMGLLESMPTRTQRLARRPVDRSQSLGGGSNPPYLGNKLPGAYISFHSSKKSIIQKAGGDPIMKRRKGKQMPLLPDLIQTKPIKSKDYHQRWAIQLYEALSTCVDRTPRRNAWRRWSEDFRLLESDGISPARIEATLNWLCQPTEIKGTSARSGRRFRQMFEDLEQIAMRATKKAADEIELPAKLKSMAKSLALRVSSKDSQASIGPGISILNQRLEKLATIMLEHTEAAPCKPIERPLLLRLAKQLKSPAVLEQLASNMIQRLNGWSKWNGDLRPSAKKLLTEDNKELTGWFDSKGITWQRTFAIFKGMICED
jgi:hypothetical protein